MDGTAATNTTVPQTNGQAAPAQQAQAPAVNPTFQQPPVGTPDRPSGPDLYRENYDLRQQIAAFNETKRLAEEEVNRKLSDALAEKGRSVEALENERTRATAREQQLNEQITAFRQTVAREKIAAVKARALAGKTFSGADDATRDAQAKLVESLADAWLDVDTDAAGNMTVVDKESRRPALEELSRRLSSPELAGFFAATNRGGSGTDGARPPANQTSDEAARRSVLADFGLLPDRGQNGLSLK